MACDCSYRANKDENISQETLRDLRSSSHLYPLFNIPSPDPSIVHLYAKYPKVISYFMRLVLLFRPGLHNTNVFRRR